ncbi:MAG: prepilin-type cleavage/methylation domain-containing protein, partial [Candidatus Hydrothermota bacterium]
GPYGGYLFGNMNFGDDFGIGNYVAATSIPGPVGERIDRKNDDGIYNRGLIQASASYAQDTVTLYWKL